MEDLPMMPEASFLRLSSRPQSSTQAVATQIYWGCGDIIIATDAGRGGELVARLIHRKDRVQ